MPPGAFTRPAVKATLEYLSRGVAISPYGTRVEALPDSAFFEDVVLVDAFPGWLPAAAMSFWEGDERGPADVTPPPSTWARPLTEAERARCAAAGRLLQSQTSRGVFCAAVAQWCSREGGKARWERPGHSRDDWYNFSGFWSRDFLRRLMGRVLHGAYTVAGQDHDDPLRRMFYNGDAPQLLRDLRGRRRRPGTYCWPLNWNAGMTLYPRYENADLGPPAEPGPGELGWVPGWPSGQAMAPVDAEPEVHETEDGTLYTMTATTGDDETTVVVYQATFTATLALPEEFAQVASGLEDALEGARVGLGTVAALSSCFPLVGPVLGLALAAVALDDDVEDAIDHLHDAAKSGGDPNDRVASFLLAIDAVLDVAQSVSDVVEFFGGKDVDVHADVTGLPSSILTRFAQSMWTQSFAYHNGASADAVGKLTYAALEDACHIEFTSDPPPGDAAWALFGANAALSYYEEWHGQRGTDAPSSFHQLPALASVSIPVIHVSDRDLDFYWDDFNGGYSPSGDNAWPFALGVLGDTETDADFLDDERWLWVELASPMLQYMSALRLATALLRENIHCEFPVAAFSGLGAYTGAVGNAVREGLAGIDGGSALVDALGGTSIGGLLAAVWRQVMVDNLIVEYSRFLSVASTGAPVEEDLEAAAPGFFELVCWMRTPEQRAALRQVFGTLPVPLGPLANPRTGGVVSALLSSGDVAAFQAAWSAMTCGQRHQLGQVIDSLDCTPEFLEEGFHEVAPASTAGLTDEPAAAGTSSRTRGTGGRSGRDWLDVDIRLGREELVEIVDTGKGRAWY